ncbi:LacI family DNA-binding transcriptional regulator [Kitasatospora sp. NPDC001159]
MDKQVGSDGKPRALPTITDVATAAGVSRQTVSNVLNAPERVRPKTRERVSRVIDELGYRPNRLAQALRANASGMIGFRVRPHVPGALAATLDRLLHTLTEVGRATGHHVLLFSAEDERAEVEACAQLYRTGAVDCVVLSEVTGHDHRPQALLDLGVPFVSFGRTFEGTQAYSWVDVDNALGTEAAVDHLVDRGHRRIGYIGWLNGGRIADQRAAGWSSAVERHGLTAQCGQLRIDGEDGVASGAQLAFALLGRPQPPTAIMAASDSLAVGVVRAAREWGLEVGRDLAVIGYDDTVTAAALELSSVSQPLERVGQEIIAAVLGQGSAPVARLLAPQLVVRSSSGRPARVRP